MTELSESFRARKRLYIYPELSESVRAGEMLTHSLYFSLSFLSSPHSFPSAPFASLYPTLPFLGYPSLPVPPLPFADRCELRSFWRYPELSESVRAGETLTH